MDIASNVKEENLMRSLDQLLKIVAEHQMVVVHVDFSTVGKERQGEGRVGER